MSPRTSPRAALALAALALGLAGAPAQAEYELDLRLLGNPQPGTTTYDPEAQGNFSAFARTFGAALNQVNLSPPETLGHSGFSLAAELAVVLLPDDAPLPTRTPFRGPLLLPSVHLRKGLPFGFELGIRASWLERSLSGAITGEVKWALNEGFKVLPDLGVRFFVTSAVGVRDLVLASGGFDLGVGKQFAVGGVMTLTPYAGWSLVFTGASSGAIDFNPTRTLAQSDTGGAQFQNILPYRTVAFLENSHNRFYGGLRLVTGVFQLGAEVAYSLLGSVPVLGADGMVTRRRDLPGVLSVNSMVGLDF